MSTIVIEALKLLDRISCLKMYKNNAHSRLFYCIAKRSIPKRAVFPSLSLESAFLKPYVRMCERSYQKL